MDERKPTTFRPQSDGRIKVYTVKDLVSTLGISRLFVLQLLNTGELKGRKVGRYWLVHEDAIREFLMNAPAPSPKSDQQ